MIEPADIDPEGVSDDPEVRDVSDMKAEGHDSARQAELESGNLDKGFFKKIWTPFRKTLAGESTVGQIGAVLKDIILPFVPSGGVINRVTDRASRLFKSQQNEKPMLKDLITRTFGSGGGSIIKVKNENGKIDLNTILASIIRAAIILGVGYVAVKLGIWGDLVELFTNSG